MRKIHEVLRLHFDHKLGQRQTARSAAVSQSTVHEYLARFAASGLTWPLPAGFGDAELEARLFAPAEAQKPSVAAYPAPDWRQVEEEMQGHKYMTLQLVWEEYRQAHPEGYSYSRFCHHYRDWKGQKDLVLRQNHRPGERMFVDWAGAKAKISDPQSGVTRDASVFVAVLGASSYTRKRLTNPS